MFSNTHFPETLHGETLDQYLKDGWFRMNHVIYNAHILRYEGKLLSPIRLRYDLLKWTPASTVQKLSKRNRALRVVFHPIEISEEHEEVYALYRQFRFGIDPYNLKMSILGPAGQNPFDTWMVDCFDGDRLIGSGLFDKGKKSAAGIISFYDPNYQSQSIGKFLIFQMLQHCKENGFDYFYPGYMIPGIPDFDYKMGMGGEATEFYQLTTDQWKSWTFYSSGEHHVEKMIYMLKQVVQLPREWKHPLQLVYNDHFDIGLYQPFADQVWDFPVFIRMGKIQSSSLELLLVFNIRTEMFELYVTEEIPDTEMIEENGEWHCQKFIATEKLDLNAEELLQLTGLPTFSQEPISTTENNPSI